MKPFDPTKPVQTRDGRRARILATDIKGVQPILAAIKVDYGNETIYSYGNDGIFWAPHGECRQDLINIPTKQTVEVYVVIFNNLPPLVFTEKGRALTYKSDCNAIGIKKVVVEVEEGEEL